MRRPHLVWGGILASLTALDVWCAVNDHDDDSLSEVIRSAFRTDTPAGRFALVGVWSGLTAWLLPHLLRGSHNALVDVVWPDTTA